MKFLTSLPLLTVIAIAVSCKKSSSLESGNNENKITNEVAKVETAWDGISAKNDYNYSAPKHESRASDEMIAAAMKRVNDKYQEYLSRLGTSTNSSARLGNLVGVIMNGGSCYPYDMVEIGMDEEDDNPQTGWDATGGNYRPNWTISGNPVLRFCIVPGNDFHAYAFTDAYGAVHPFRYAVLRVKTNFYPDAFEINRFIDNEDNNNANFERYHVQSAVKYTDIRGGAMRSDPGNLYRTYIDGNSLLSFHVFDGSRLTPTIFTHWPDLNSISYGVFATSGNVNLPYADANSRSILYLDDEDNRNANSITAEENMSPWYNPFTDGNNPLQGCVEGVFKAGGFFRTGGYVDTKLYLAKVR